MLQRQVEQGNPEDVTVFEKNKEIWSKWFWITLLKVVIFGDMLLKKNFESF